MKCSYMVYNHHSLYPPQYMHQRLHVSWKLINSKKWNPGFPKIQEIKHWKFVENNKLLSLWYDLMISFLTAPEWFLTLIQSKTHLWPEIQLLQMEIGNGLLELSCESLFISTICHKALIVLIIYKWTIVIII